MAKLKQYGGNIHVVVALPEIRSFRLNDMSHDFILIGSDGVFDKLSSEELAAIAWK